MKAGTHAPGTGMTSERTRRRLVQRLRGAGIRDERVLGAMLEVPRHLFIDEALASRAYENTALPIGFRQTISQPYVVARMAELVLGTGRRRRVLEIGTGSGYQAAVLARIVPEVYTVERIKALMHAAMNRIYHLGLRNVRFRHGDGTAGWAAHAPYDGIVVTAAAASVPQSLKAQLGPGGRLVIPVGAGRRQHLRLIVRTGRGFSDQVLEPATFVPLVGGTA